MKKSQKREKIKTHSKEEILWARLPIEVRREIREILDEIQAKSQLRICPICKKSFSTLQSFRKYCSGDCAKQATRKVREGKIPCFKILTRDGFRCHFCGRSPHKDPNVILVVDHILPLSKGGGLGEENLISSCQDCNSEKHAILLKPETIEFLKD